MSSTAVLMPLAIPLLTAALCVALYRYPRSQSAVGILGALAMLVSAMVLLVRADAGQVLTMQMGSWAAPFGITFAADRLGAIMVCLAGVMGLVVSIYGISDIDTQQRRAGFYPLLHVLLMGCAGAFLTGDLFNLYVWFEVLLLSSFALLSLGGGRSRMEGTVKYVALNMIGSMLFLAGVGVLYGSTGTLNMADLHSRVAVLYAEQPMLVTALAGMFILAFSMKAALFPLFFWLPASYHVPSSAICAVFAALLTKVGIVALVRVFTLIFAAVEPMFVLVLVLTSITMVSGVLGAVTQYEIKRILAWHSISQVGYIVVGFGLLSSSNPEVKLLGLAAVVVFLVHHGLVKPALFLIGGLVYRATGTTQLKPIGGLARAMPWLAGLFMLAAMSLAGIPPLSGFWAKLAVIRAGLVAEQYGVIAAALAAGLLTLLSMIKIWNEAFWKEKPVDENATEADTNDAVLTRVPLTMVLPTVALVVLVTLIGLFPQGLLGYAERTAGQVLNTADYVEAVGVESAKLDMAVLSKARGLDQKGGER